MAVLKLEYKKYLEKCIFCAEMILNSAFQLNVE